MFTVLLCATDFDFLKQSDIEKYSILLVLYFLFFLNYSEEVSLFLVLWKQLAKTYLCSFFYEYLILFYYYYFLILTGGNFFIAFRERGRERKKQQSERETLIGCLPQHPDQGRQARETGMKPATQVCCALIRDPTLSPLVMGQRSNQLNHMGHMYHPYIDTYTFTKWYIRIY